jgi:hypothetical protein
MRLRPNPYRWDRVNLSLFYGRQTLLDNLCQKVQDGYSYAIVGGRRMGKTTLLRKLEAELMGRLQNTRSGLIAVPAYVDVLGLPHPLTPRSVYDEIVKQIEQNLKQVKILPSSWSTLCTVIDQHRGAENQGFSDVLNRLVQTVTEGYLQIVVLFDEIEPIAQSEWGQGFFDNWRQFLSNHPVITPHLAAIFAGAREMQAIARDIGSPLSNVLTWQELALFDAADTAALVNEPTNNHLPPTIARRVFSQTGGHPFLIQYLMSVICENELDAVGPRQVQLASRQFLREQASQFHNWWFEKFSAADRQVYARLIERGKAVPRGEIVTVVGDIAADQALRTLMHTGVIRPTSKGNSYRVAGLLFKKWFGQYGILIPERGQHDQIVEAKLHALDPQLVNRYVTAWKILGTDLNSYSGAVSEIRDVLTQVLHTLAPDIDVMDAPDYKPEADQTRPTRRQRTYFLMRQRGRRGKVAGTLENDLNLFDTLLKQLSKTVNEAYSHASSRTHISATYEQAWRCLKQLDSVLAQLLPDVNEDKT